ncbi:MAG: BamA/TamA family outer membrane protein [bacterium]
MALALALGAGAAHAQYFGQNKIQYRGHEWHSIRSQHFEVFFDAGADSLAMRTLDLSEKAHEAFAVRTGHRLSKRVPIILYASHHEFAQTNVTSELIDGSTGGFTEALRNRVVVPVSGSYEDFRHVLVHELVHAFQFDILYHSSGVSLLSGQGLFGVPLWFAEGMAEYLSLGMEPNAEMYVRDGTLTGYLPPLEWAGGYLVYKMGQSAIQYLVDEYGADRFREVLRRLRQMRNFDRAFTRTYGMTPQRFDELWRAHLRRKYWPRIATLEHPESFARRLTDHRRDESVMNFWPSISPQGDRVAYFSDRRQYNDVYLMSAFDGRVLKRVVESERDLMFEAIPLLRTSIAWSPDGQQLALVVGSAGKDRLYVVDADDGRLVRSFDIPALELSFPAWSPVSDSIVVSGLSNGRADLYLIDAGTSQVTRLTDDAWDEKEPTWSPDGRTLAFASDRLTPVVLHPFRQQNGFGRYALYTMDVASRTIQFVLDTSGEDHAPAWSPDGRKLAFITDHSGAPTIALLDLTDSTVTQLTDLTGGVMALSWARHTDRLVFSAFDRGGYDLFAIQEPLSSPALLARMRKHVPGSVTSIATVDDPPPPFPDLPANRGALSGTWPDSLTVPDTSRASRTRDRVRVDRGGLPPATFETVAWEGGGYPQPMPNVGEERDTTRKERVAPTPVLERGGPFALSDTVLSQRPQPYRWKLALEAVQVGAIAASSYGFAGSTQLLFSDFLGDRNLYFAGDLFSNSLEDANIVAIYSYQPRRLDWSVGAFHYKNYYQSRVTTLGQPLSGLNLFSERSFGVLAGVSDPFDRFRRFETQFTQMFVDQDFFRELPNGDIVRVRSDYRTVTSPSLSLVGDNALFGEFGPVNGGRWNLTYSPAFNVFPKSLEYHTLSFDRRRYINLSRGYSIGIRTLAGVSSGRDPQAFQVGGFSTLRGYPDFDIVGTRLLLTNVELRFPFVDQLGIVGPLPLGSLRHKGVLFADLGTVWNEGTSPRLWWIRNGRRLKDPYFSFGTGVRSWLLGLPMKLDVAWASDLQDTRKPRWHFSIGPEF